MIVKMKKFIKKEVILVISWILAAASMFVIHPSKTYADYIDWRTLGILWSLMIIMAGLKQNGFFNEIGNHLLKMTKGINQLVIVLVYLPFFFSMIITNDVALITFVPFAVLMLKKSHCEELMIPVIVLQTAAANLGSMLTPIGNPQNLYLYGVSGADVVTFISWMLPYTLITGIAIFLSIFIFTGKIKKSEENQNMSENISEKISRNVIKDWGTYFVLFALALATVSRIVPYYILVATVLIVALIIDKKLILKVDYSLLFTFAGFFIFTGNMGNIAQIQELMQHMLGGREVMFGILLSQVISNVPATLLLSRFTANTKALLLGVNFGGLGTLIASMASLISYKIFANEYDEYKGKYFLVFTVVGLIYLALLLVSYLLFN